jgi:hypothetical protein
MLYSVQQEPTTGPEPEAIELSILFLKDHLSIILLFTREPRCLSRNSYELDNGGSILGRGGFFFLASRPALTPTQSPIQWVAVAVSPRVKRPGLESDYSP